MRLTQEQRVLVLENRGLVNKCIDRLRSKMGLTGDLEEMTQDGMLGLCQAAADFDPALGYRFSTFAWRRIGGSVIDGARSRSQFNRHTHTRPILVGLDSCDEDSYDPSDAIDGRLTLNALAEDLPERARIMLSLILDGYTQADLMRTNLISKSRVSDLLKRYRREMAKRSRIRRHPVDSRCVLR